MPFFVFIFALFVQTTLFSQNNIEVENIYSQAIDARFSGDLARARHLLETLQEQQVTNEFILSLLVEVYGEYLIDLIQKKDQQTFQIAYPGIRKNIADIWEIHPDSESIQDNALKITWMTRDQELGLLLSTLILERNPDHLLANYFAGIYRFKPNSYRESLTYFQKSALADVVSGKEQFIFQSRVYLGDIFLEEKKYPEALQYYELACKLSSSPDLVAKIAFLEASLMRIKNSQERFQSIPIHLMTDELLNSYVAVLWQENSKESISLMNLILSQNKHKTDFLKALTQAQRGRTQTALKILSNETFVKTELPSLYYHINLDLMNRLGTKDLTNMHRHLGKSYFDIKDYSQAKKFLLQTDFKKDSSGQTAYMLGTIAREEWFYSKAREYQTISLQQQKTINSYTELLEVELSFKNFSTAEKLIKEASTHIENSTIWADLMIINMLIHKKDYTQAEQKLVKLSSEIFDPVLLYPFLSIVYNELDQVTKAEEFLKKAYQVDPFNIRIKNQLAYLYSTHEKNLDEALELALSVIIEAPEDIIYLDTLAWIYTLRQEYNLAQDVFDTIEQKLKNIEFIPDSEEIYAHLGFYYTKINNTSKSKYYFDLGLKQNKDHKYLNKLIELSGYNK